MEAIDSLTEAGAWAGEGSATYLYLVLDKHAEAFALTCLTSPTLCRATHLPLSSFSCSRPAFMVCQRVQRVQEQ